MKETPRIPLMGVHRHYYSESGLFEQSLDVYVPQTLQSPTSVVRNAKGSKQHEFDANADPVVVALVVGSGWLGHNPLIYSGTSWWNSAAPKTIASLGYTCICIRHRGAFPQFPNYWLIAASVAAAMLLSFGWWNPITLAVIGVVLSFWTFLLVAGKGDAEYEDMLADVADALKFVHDNYSTVTGIETAKRPQLVFGGYSSGAHVAASVLHRPWLFQEREMPPPTAWIRAVLYLSGVLASQPREEDMTKPQNDGQLSTKHQWFTDWILRVVFRENMNNVPSPLHMRGKPHIPHILMACKHETFGVPVADVFFCSKQYAYRLKEVHGIPTDFIELPAVNHWDVLGSRVLRNALGEELLMVSEAGRSLKATAHHDKSTQVPH